MVCFSEKQGLSWVDMDIIPNIRKIVSLDMPELQPYRTLRRHMAHIKNGIFVAEGEKVVRRLLASNLTIVSLLLTPLWLDQLFPHKSGSGVVMPSHSELQIFLAEKSMLESIVGYNLHQGIMAVATIPAEKTLLELAAAAPAPHFLVAMDGLVNAENVGVVVRNCAGFGVDGIIVGKTSGSPYLRRAVRNSMGTVFAMSVVHSSNLIKSFDLLRTNYGTKIIAAHPDERSSIHTADFTGNICIVLGNEGNGVSEHVLGACDFRIAIPMMNGADSLNVASASAVFMYEARKQRK